MLKYYSAAGLALILQKSTAVPCVTFECRRKHANPKRGLSVHGPFGCSKEQLMKVALKKSDDNGKLQVGATVQ